MEQILQTEVSCANRAKGLASLLPTGLISLDC